MKEVVEAKSFQEIASKINRKINKNISSISREIKKNKKGRKGNKDLKQAQYSFSKTQEKAQNM